MDKTNILVVANHPEILATILRLINKNEDWTGVGAGSAEEAVNACKSEKFELVLLGVGISEEAEMKILPILKFSNPDLVCLRHFGGGSGLLYSEIQHALSTRGI